MDKIPQQSVLTKSNDIGQKQLTKLKDIPLPSVLDLNLTSVYFTTIRDGFSRILILLINILWIGLVFFNGVAIGQLIGNSGLFPSLPNIQMAVLQIITIIITILFSVMMLIMLLPIFLAKTIKAINLTCVIFLTLGTIINLMIMAVSFFMFFDSNSPYRANIMILLITGIGFWWIVIINWWFSTKKNKKHLVRSIIKMYDLGYK